MFLFCRLLKKLKEDQLKNTMKEFKNELKDSKRYTK